MNNQKKIFLHWKVLIFCMCYYIPWALIMYLLKDNYTIEPGAYFKAYPIITIIIAATCLVFPLIYGIYGYIKSKSILITTIIHLIVTITTFTFINLFMYATIRDILDIILALLLFSAILTLGCFFAALITKIIIKISGNHDERKIIIISIISIAVIIYLVIRTITNITNIIRLL